jgi:hypothetical protein
MENEERLGKDYWLTTHQTDASDIVEEEFNLDKMLALFEEDVISLHEPAIDMMYFEKQINLIIFLRELKYDKLLAEIDKFEHIHPDLQWIALEILKIKID